MSLLGPDDGSLISLPGLGGPSTDPLLAEAVLLLRAGQLNPDSYDDGDSVPNEGTGGSALNGVGTVGKAHLTRADDPDVFAVHVDTNVLQSFTTPDSAGLSIVGDIDLRARFRAIGDAEAGGTEDHSQVIGKIKSANSGDSGYDETDYGLSVGLADPFTPGEVTLTWFDSSNVQHSVPSTGAALDPYAWNELKATLDVDNGAGGHTVTFYTKASGSWVQIGSPVITAGTTDIRNGTGPLTAACFSTMVEYAEVRSGIDGTLAANFQATDATSPSGSGDTWTATTTGETWTVKLGAAVMPRPTDQGFIGGQRAYISVPDAAAVDIGATDWTIAARIYVPAIADANGDTFVYFSKRSGTPGQGGTGWEFADLKIDAFSIDGAGAVAADGGGGMGDTALAISNTGWTTGWHTVAFTFTWGGNLVTYVDGTARGSASLGSVGSIDTSTAILLGDITPHIWTSHVQWDRVLTADELAALPYLLA